MVVSKAMATVETDTENFMVINIVDGHVMAKEPHFNRYKIRQYCDRCLQLGGSIAQQVYGNLNLRRSGFGRTTHGTRAGDG